MKHPDIEALLPPGTKLEDFLHHDNAIMHHDRPVMAFQPLPVRLLKRYKDRGRVWKPGDLSLHVEHMPGENHWSLLAGILLLESPVIEGVHFEFVEENGD
jgi:hypothetical protein